MKRIQNYFRRIQQQSYSTYRYMRHAFEGDHIERRTDFNKLKKPVLLIHGYAASRRVFNILETRLRRDGFSVFSIRLGGIFDTFNTRPIPELAEYVAKKIESLYERYPIKEKISIIGHSKGGLIGRCYIKDFGGDRRVKTLITLGTPHRGNFWATLGLFTPLAFLTESIRQMSAISPFLRRMNKTPWPRQVKIVSIYSKADNVCPFPGSVLEVPENQHNSIKNIEVDDVGHIEFLHKKRIYEIIRQELQQGKFSERRLPTPRKIQKLHLSSRSKAQVRQ